MFELIKLEQLYKHYKAEDRRQPVKSISTYREPAYSEELVSTIQTCLAERPVNRHSVKDLRRIVGENRKKAHDELRARELSRKKPSKDDRLFYRKKESQEIPLGRYQRRSGEQRPDTHQSESKSEPGSSSLVGNFDPAERFILYCSSHDGENGEADDDQRKSGDDQDNKRKSNDAKESDNDSKDQDDNAGDGGGMQQQGSPKRKRAADDDETDESASSSSKKSNLVAPSHLEREETEDLGEVAGPEAEEAIERTHQPEEQEDNANVDVGDDDDQDQQSEQVFAQPEEQANVILDNRDDNNQDGLPGQGNDQPEQQDYVNPQPEDDNVQDDQPGQGDEAIQRAASSEIGEFNWGGDPNASDVEDRDEEDLSQHSQLDQPQRNVQQDDEDDEVPGPNIEEDEEAQGPGIVADEVPGPEVEEDEEVPGPATVEDEDQDAQGLGEEEEEEEEEEEDAEEKEASEAVSSSSSITGPPSDDSDDETYDSSSSDDDDEPEVTPGRRKPRASVMYS